MTLRVCLALFLVRTLGVAAELGSHEAPENADSWKEDPSDAMYGNIKRPESFGGTLNPVCTGLTCPHLECAPPLTVKRDGTCCGYFWAPDHLVASVYRSPMEGETSEYLT